jgi:hypothetical protein
MTKLSTLLFYCVLADSAIERNEQSTVALDHAEYASALRGSAETYTRNFRLLLLADN